MFALIFSLALFSVSAVAADPRNAPGYQVLFDLEANGEAEIVEGYGAYLQLFVGPSSYRFRYCDNFEGKGLNGAPNRRRQRKRHVPIGTTDATAYICHDYSPAEVAAGRDVIAIGGKSMFALRSANWRIDRGGDLYFQFAKRIPLIGSPTYRTLRIRALRLRPTDLEFTVESVLPRVGVRATEFLSFAATTSGLGIPNGIDGLVLNRGTRTAVTVDLDHLEE